MVALTIYTHYDMVYQSEWKFTIERCQIDPTERKEQNNHFLLTKIYSTSIKQEMYEDNYVYMDGIARYVYVFYTIIDINGLPVEDDEAQEVPNRPPIIVRQINIQRITNGIAEIQRREDVVRMQHIPPLVL
jgi:hypothetical protein